MCIPSAGKSASKLMAKLSCWAHSLFADALESFYDCWLASSPDVWIRHRPSGAGNLPAPCCQINWGRHHPWSGIQVSCPQDYPGMLSLSPGKAVSVWHSHSTVLFLPTSKIARLSAIIESKCSILIPLCAETLTDEPRRNGKYWFTCFHNRIASDQHTRHIAHTFNSEMHHEKKRHTTE